MSGLVCPGIVLFGVYVVGFLFGSVLLRAILRFVDSSLRARLPLVPRLRDIGFWIGACEHFLVVTFVLFHDFVAIGLIFAAKELVRGDKVREEPTYYLLGTLLSISIALFWGLVARLLLQEACP